MTYPDDNKSYATSCKTDSLTASLGKITERLGEVTKGYLILIFWW